MQADGRARMTLYGPFRLEDGSGQLVKLSSRKAKAILAILARTPGGTRSRAWLLDRLWSRHDREAQLNGLRRELSELRRSLAVSGLDLLGADTNRVWLCLDRIAILPPADNCEFLEGIDIPGEEDFEDWLRMERVAAPPNPPAAPLPLPHAFADRPALAVLPIAAIGSDPDLRWMAEGLFDEVVESISRLRWLPVVSTRDANDPLVTGRQLGASYVLDGRLSQQEGSYWFSCRLQDVSAGRVLWSPRLELAAPHSSGLPGSFQFELASMIDWRVDDAEQQRARTTPDQGLGLRELIWRGRWHQNRLTTADMKLAEQYFQAALDHAPDSALTQIEWAQHLGYKVWNSRADDEAIARIRYHAQRATVIDPHDPRGHMLAGMAETWLRRPETAELMLRRSLTLNPSLPMTLDQLATLFNLTGRSAQAIEPLELSVRLSPSEFRLFFKQGELALAHLFCGKLEEAEHYARQSLSLRPSYWHAHVILIAALRESGQSEEARTERHRLQQSRPNFRADYIEWIPFTDRRHTDFLRSAVEAA